jgi:hypothetical protein
MFRRFLGSNVLGRQKAEFVMSTTFQRLQRLQHLETRQLPFDHERWNDAIAGDLRQIQPPQTPKAAL